MSASQVEQPSQAGSTPVEGQPGEREQHEQQQDRGARVRALDFSQPTKFTTELRRRIGRALDLFSEALGAYLSGELKAEVDVTLADVSQYTWAAAKAQLPADAIAVGIHAESIERHMLMSVEQPLVLQALECLLGGEAADAPAERHLTEIDWVLTRGVLDAVVHQLSTVWQELGGTALTRGDLDIEGDAGVLTPIGEPTLSVVLETKIDELASAISLLIPWGAIEPFTESIRSSGREPRTDPRGAHALRRSLAGAQVLLRAEVGSVQMPIEQMLELGPGALLALEQRAEEGVSLFAEGISLGRGHPGRSGQRRAVKLAFATDAPVRADTYAKLGRTELERARAHLKDTRASAAGRAILASIFVRVWAELGRTHLPLGRALDLTQGAVVELDQGAEQPVELFANGLCFANGSLVVTADGAWGVQVATLLH
ncbi:MAG TPA: FliM/FliN family flagellar motor switch protein [Solirubrobacteraceae bacterium]|nr:FliM/FliN family flagellar motor switch protein [Solirubrobacteraceae bacterium]